jgi:DNA-binding CsgD family transcriptional regulator
MPDRRAPSKPAREAASRYERRLLACALLGFARPAGIALRTRGVLAGGEHGLNDLREAAELLAGANARLERAREELQATGARPRRALLTGLEALTASERRVAELAADGMSNPQIAQALFITLNTVEGHLRHACQKLSISGRGQLPAAREPPRPRRARRAGGQRARWRPRRQQPGKENHPAAHMQACQSVVKKSRSTRATTAGLPSFWGPAWPRPASVTTWPRGITAASSRSAVPR